MRGCHRGRTRAGPCVAGSSIRAAPSPDSWPACSFAPGSRASSTSRARAPFILVSNHCSNLDPPILGWATGHQIDRIVHFMAKVEMRSWPIIGWLATQSAVYFVRRGEGDRAAQRFSMEALVRGAPDRAVRRGHALARRSPEGRQARRRPPRDANGRAAASRSGSPARTASFPADRAGRTRRASSCASVTAFSLAHEPDGRLDRAALTEGTDRIMREIAALLPPEQRPIGASSS